MRCNNYSIPRSKEIMRIFKDMELVEQLGSGIPRILQFYGKECFYFSDNYVRMSFPIEVSDGSINEGLNGGLNGGLNDGLNGGLNETDSVILSVIENKPGIQLKEIVQLIENVSQRTIERQIAELIRRELIERKGSRKTGGYYLLKNKN